LGTSRIACNRSLREKSHSQFGFALMATVDLVWRVSCAK
jgi:hypothetical protein